MDIDLFISCTFLTKILNNKCIGWSCHGRSKLGVNFSEKRTFKVGQWCHILNCTWSFLERMLMEDRYTAAVRQTVTNVAQFPTCFVIEHIWLISRYLIIKNVNIEFELFSIACSSGQYFPVIAQLSWVNTVSVLGRSIPTPGRSISTPRRSIPTPGRSISIRGWSIIKPWTEHHQLLQGALPTPIIFILNLF